MDFTRLYQVKHLDLLFFWLIVQHFYRNSIPANNLLWQYDKKSLIFLYKLINTPLLLMLSTNYSLFKILC